MADFRIVSSVVEMPFGFGILASGIYQFFKSLAVRRSCVVLVEYEAGFEC